jgi:hypothetical protein
MQKIYFPLFFIFLLFSSCGTTEEEETIDTCVSPKEHKVQKLAIPKNNQIYFGAFANFGHDENDVTKKKISDFEALATKKVAFVTISNNWHEGIKYPKNEIHCICSVGSTPLIRLMPRSNNKQLGNGRDPVFSLDKIIDGKFDKELREWARDAKEDNIPLLLDFAPEMTGFWFQWNGKHYGAGTLDGYGDPTYPDGPEIYRDAYRHVVDIFRDENVTHVTWIFHPDIQRWPDVDWNSAKYYYPGDDYVDWIGFSIYGVQNEKWGWVTFSDTVEKWYKIHIKDLIEISDKPMAVLEMGVTDGRSDGTKKEWFEDAFSTILDNQYIKFNAINYWHESWTTPSGVEAKLKIDSSKESLETFQKLINNPRFISQTEFIEE